jgi:hypothetical protein
MIIKLGYADYMLFRDNKGMTGQNRSNVIGTQKIFLGIKNRQKNGFIAKRAGYMILDRHFTQDILSIPRYIKMIIFGIDPNIIIEAKADTCLLFL